jgi:hypothetical protein
LSQRHTISLALIHSALIRRALQEHLKHLHELELEEQERRAYMAQPQRDEEFRILEDVAVWPEN